MRGGERCLEVFCELFPEAPLYTLLHVPGSVSPTIEGRRIVTSFVQRLPGAATRYRQYLPLFPAAVRGLALDGHDLVISLSHCVAKAVRVAPGALHRRLHDRSREVEQRFEAESLIIFNLLFQAFERGKVTVVSPLNATYALWGVILSALVLRKTEAVTPRVGLAGALIVAGAAAVAATR